MPCAYVLIDMLHKIVKHRDQMCTLYARHAASARREAAVSQ